MFGDIILSTVNGIAITSAHPMGKEFLNRNDGIFREAFASQSRCALSQLWSQ